MLLELSNLFGGFISKIAIIAIESTNIKRKVTKIPDQIGTVVKPTQSYASLNFVAPLSNG